MNATIYTPPGRTNRHINSLKIFLAGSIDMGNSEDWQEVVAKRLAALDSYREHLEIYNPRRKDWDDTWGQTLQDANFNAQVNWELTNMDKADYVIMNFLPESKSPITLLELGLNVHRNRRLLVVCPPEFYRAGNVHAVCNKYNVPVFETIDDLFEQITDEGRLTL